MTDKKPLKTLPSATFVAGGNNSSVSVSHCLLICVLNVSYCAITFVTKGIFCSEILDNGYCTPKYLVEEIHKWKERFEA